MVLGACSQAEEADQPPPETVAETVDNSAKSETSEEPPEVLSPRSPQTDAEKALDQALQRLGDDFEGEIGIAIHDHETGWQPTTRVWSIFRSKVSASFGSR